jgi:AcrR family transcriptional regulator
MSGSTTTVMPVREAGVSTRQRLIDAGYELFSRQGFHGVGLDLVLRDAGVSKQTFYNHFESKDELVLAVLEKRTEVELAGLRESLARLGGADPRARLEALWDVMGEWFNSPDFRGCIFITAAAEFPSRHDPAHVAAAGHALRIIEVLEELAREAGASEPRELAERLMMLVDGALIAKHVCGNDRAAELGREVARGVVGRYVPKDKG